MSNSSFKKTQYNMNKALMSYTLLTSPVEIHEDLLSFFIVIWSPFESVGLISGGVVWIVIAEALEKGLSKKNNTKI